MHIYGKFSTLFKITVLACVLTAVFTFPFITKLDSYSNDYDDYPLTAYAYADIFRWVISGNTLHPYVNSPPSQFYPFGYTHIAGDLLITSSLLYGPLFLLLKNSVLALNFFSLFTLVMNFISAFFVLNYFLKNGRASIVGATIFTFNPLVFSHFPVHLPLLQLYFFPWIFLSLYLLFKNPNWKKMLITAGLITLNALNSVYFQIMMVLSIPLFVSPFIISNLHRRNFTYFKRIFLLSILAVPFLLLILFIDLPHYRYSQKEGMKRSIEQTVFYSARLTDFFASTPDNFLYGSLVRKIEPARLPKEYNGSFNYQEHTLFLNLLPVTLFILGIYLLVKLRRKLPHPCVYAGLVLIGTVSFVIQWGPYLALDNGTLPQIKLPYYFLYRTLPFLKGIQGVTRFGIIFYIPFVFFISFAAERIFLRFPKSKNLLLVFLMTGILLENINLRPYTDRSSTHESVTVFRNNHPDIAGLLKNRNTMHFPSFVSIPNRFYWEVRYLTWSMYTGENLLNSLIYLPRDWIGILSEMDNHISTDTIRILKSMQAEYLVIHKDFYREYIPDKLPEFQHLQNLDLKEIILFENDAIVILDLSKYTEKISTCTGLVDTDVDLQLSPYVISTLPLPIRLTITNKKGCYLYSPGDNRYLETKISINNSKKAKLYFKIPLLILPGEKAVMAETISSDNPIYKTLVKGNNQVTAYIEKLGIKSVRDITFEHLPSAEPYSFLKYNTVFPGKRMQYSFGQAYVTTGDTVLTIDTDLRNSGDTIWLPALDDLGGMKSYKAAHLVAELLDEERKALVSDNGKGFLFSCPNSLAVSPGETANFYCKYRLSSDIISRAKFLKLFMFVEPDIIMSGEPYIYRLR